MIPDSEILACSEFEVKSKIGKLFRNEKILEEYSVRMYENDPFFYEHHKEKIKVDKNGCEYILFRIDAYFTESFLAVEMNKTTKAEKLFLKKKHKHQKKKLCCKFIRINISDAERAYDTYYEVSKMEIFFIKFKEKRIKEKENKIKELEDEIK